MLEFAAPLIPFETQVSQHDSTELSEAEDHSDPSGLGLYTGSDETVGALQFLEGDESRIK